MVNFALLWAAGEGAEESWREKPESENEDAAEDEMRANWICADGGVGGGERGNKNQPDEKNDDNMFGPRSGKKLCEAVEMKRVRDARNCGEQAERNIHQEKNGEAVARRRGRGLIGARKGVALGGKNFHPSERERNGRSQQESHQEEGRELRVQMAKRREKVEHGLV